MEPEVLRQLHLEWWNITCDFMQTKLEPPYLAIDEVDGAFSEFHYSKFGERRDIQTGLPDVPTSMSIVLSGRMYNLTFSFGGILIPNKCLEDKMEETLAGLVHEQVHETLRARGVVYGLNKVFSEPAVQQVFDNFTEFMAHSMTIQVLSPVMSPGDYVKVPITLYNPRAGMVSESVEEDIKAAASQYTDFLQQMRGRDPIQQWNCILADFVNSYYPNEGRLTANSFKQICGLSRLYERRNFHGEWKRFEPFLI